jgi:hypothetical protein
MKTVLAAIALAATAFAPAAVADCGAEHAAMSASIKPSSTPAPEAKAPTLEKAVASSAAKQPVAKAKAGASDQKVASNATK